MKEDGSIPQINMSKIPVGGGVAGLFFAAVTVLIFLIGVPVIRYMFPAALLLGGAVSLMIHFGRHKTPGLPWIRPATKK